MDPLLILPDAVTDVGAHVSTMDSFRFDRRWLDDRKDSKREIKKVNETNVTSLQPPC